MSKQQLQVSGQGLDTAQGSSLNSNKPITATFDLETKIRVIIQEVLAATMRKVSQFHEKVEGFEKFFFTYSQRINDIEDKGKTNEQTLMRLFETVVKNKQAFENNQIKIEEGQEKLRLEKNQLHEDIREVHKKINTINRQNQNISNEFSNTKKKFLEFSEQITSVKEEVAWKITRYVEETAEINTQIQINNQEIKKEYFNINLALQKNKQKYEEIISAKDLQEELNQQFKEMLTQAEQNMRLKGEDLKNLNRKLEQMDTALYAKIKTTETKLQKRLDELVQSNVKIQASVSKVDGFAKILEEIREQSEQVRRQIMKKFQQTNQKNNDRLEKEVLDINMAILNLQKQLQKKVKHVAEAQEKNVDFFNQKMQYLKIQIQTQISSKATRMLEEKSKSQNGVTNTALEHMQQKINKLQLQTKKDVNKIQNAVKQVKAEVRNQMEQVKQSVESRITTTIRIIEQSTNSGVSPQFIQSINDKIEKVADAAEMKICNFSKEITSQNLRMLALQNMKKETEQKFARLKEQNKSEFAELDQKVTSKVERVLYTVTKMRGDAIIRNEFTDKQIKELKRIVHNTEKEVITMGKIFPAVGECINLVMCLIFDAEFQHSKIIQDSLPGLSKDVMKFQNLVEGVLYEFSEKKKPGYIMYRHKEQKKIDIVKATFNAYTSIWEQLFDKDFKERQELIPKSFYKKYVEKNIGKQHTARGEKSPGKDMSQPASLQQREGSSKEHVGHPASDDSRGSLHRGGVDSTDLNRSFHIRRKRLSTIKTKDDLIMVVQEELREEK